MKSASKEITFPCAPVKNDLVEHLEGDRIEALASPLSVPRSSRRPTLRLCRQTETKSAVGWLKRSPSVVADRDCGADEDDSASVASQLDGKSREWLVRAAQGDYQALAKLAAEEPRLTRLKVNKSKSPRGNQAAGVYQTANMWSGSPMSDRERVKDYSHYRFQLSNLHARSLRRPKEDAASGEKSEHKVFSLCLAVSQTFHSLSSLEKKTENSACTSFSSGIFMEKRVERGNRVNRVPRVRAFFETFEPALTAVHGPASVEKAARKEGGGGGGGGGGRNKGMKRWERWGCSRRWPGGRGGGLRKGWRRLNRTGAAC
ncbi:hypothetical protein K0M31_014764 [Melipona bicolor]|uniref:Uncharacterized protein n=1 Tax=Melipona bicolor TaxID=60889 RepID=A0AA40KFT2_9HYME|nr:hypothetical protein K0M31_014764 [Melipona bicolor]